MSIECYYIWSFEHQAWWRPGGFGYTRDIERAGTFELPMAAAFVERANQYLPLDSPNEALVPIEELAEFLESFPLSGP
jgi:hypothetical protein